VGPLLGIIAIQGLAGKRIDEREHAAVAQVAVVGDGQHAAAALLLMNRTNTCSSSKTALQGTGLSDSGSHNWKSWTAGMSLSPLMSSLGSTIQDLHDLEAAGLPARELSRLRTASRALCIPARVDGIDGRAGTSG
jgi:hypothetical protein